ncbi:hypothetical protein [Sagittula sp. SSi028]|uniref:hypothetical protein n=1 Tax=Sagittula sp. SSi028 TaxID=3400636 RepID=UPI003AF89D33
MNLVLCIIAGALAVGAGALGALLLDPAVVGGAALLILLRICWLDDNIANDLMQRDDLPVSYVNAQKRRLMFQRAVFGRMLGDLNLCPLSVATGMRAEMQLWTATLVAGAAATLAQTAPLGLWLSSTLALAGFAVAFRTADRLTATLWLVERGQTLQREDLLRRPQWPTGQ